MQAARQHQPFILRPFQPHHAPTIAGWVTTEEQLRLLAPSTTLPLTAQKIVAWRKKTGEAFVLQSGNSDPPVGYGEINPMTQEPQHFWLGHVVVAPAMRGKKLGQLLVNKMTHYAFRARTASRVSLIVFPENQAAISCYKRVGYREIGPEFQRFGSQGPLMKLLRLQIERHELDFA